MKPTSPNNSVQQRQRLSKSMKKSKKVSPAKSEGTSSLTAVDDTMKAVELGPDTNLKCNFCGKGPATDDLKSGKFYQLHNYSIHFFCLLFAFNGEQKGEDEEGLNGFLVSDVKTQVDKGRKHKCMYCDKPGAMSKCQWSDKKKHACGKWLHFPCGLEAGATFQFLNSMDVYCGKHRVKQDPKLLATTPPDYDCVVCYDEVAKDSEEATKIVVPCCHRHFHRSCVQSMALASGKHHFKCPNCNNNEIYVDEIEKLGIYIPNADATWETEEHSAFYNYRDMYVQERRCGAEVCVCVKEEGRNFHEEDGDFEVVLCKFCGTAGCHVRCGQLDISDPEFTCKDCTKETSESDIDDLLNSESDESLGNSTLDLSSDTSVTDDDLSSGASVTGDENEEEDYSDMVIKFLNVHGEMTSSCLKCGHSIPAYQVGAMIEHIKAKHVKSKNASKPSSEASRTSKSESSNIIERLNQLLADDDDAPVASSATKDDAFMKKFDDESDELDKLLKSVSDDKEAEVEPTVESVIQNFDDENDELEMLLKEIEDGDGEDNVAEVVNESKEKTGTKENDSDAQDLIVLGDAHLKLQRLLETHRSEESDVEVPKANKNVSEEANSTKELLDESFEEPAKPKYKPGPKSKKHKLAIITPEPPKAVPNSIEVPSVKADQISSKVAIVKPEVKKPSHMTNAVPAKESTMIFKNTSMKVVSQSSENIDIEPLIKSTDKVVQDSTSEGKLASIKEKISALQQKTEAASTSILKLSGVDHKQNLLEPQPRYRPGPKSRKSKLLVTKTVEKDDSIVDTSEKEAKNVNDDEEIPLVTSPSVSVESRYKPGPKSRKMNSEKEIMEVDMTEVNEIIIEQNSDSKRSTEYLRPGPKSKKLKTQKLKDIEDQNNLTSKYISKEDLQIILGELNKLASDYNDNVFFIGDIKPKERHVIFTFWKVMDRSFPADSLDTLKCEQCNKCFSERCELSEHMSSVCTNQFENIFNFIEQQFINPSDVSSTKKRIFDFIKEKIYSFFGQKWCFLCGKTVKTLMPSMPSYGLVSHMILCHFKKELSDECKTSKSPFLCPITKQGGNKKQCSLKFSSHSLLLSHLAGYHARTDHILRNCTTINNLTGTKPITKVCKCESCGKDVTNKLSLKFHIAIEKTDYETVEMLSSKKCGEKDCTFQAKFSSEEMIRHFGAAHLEIVGGKSINRIKVLPKETFGKKGDTLNNTLDGLYANSDDDKIDIVQEVEPTANQDSKEPRRQSLKLVNINKLIQSPFVKESSPCSWYTITTKPSSSFKRSVSTAATQPPPSVTPVPTSKQPSVTPVPTSKLPSVTPVPTSKLPSVTPVPTSKLPSLTPVPTSKLDRSSLSLKSNRISPAASGRTPSPTATSQPSQSVDRNQTPPPVVLKTPLPTIAEKPSVSPQIVQINKSASKPKETPSSNKTISSGPLQTASIQAVKPSSKSAKTPPLKNPNQTVPNPTPRILAQTSITPLPSHVSETSSPETSETFSTESSLPTLSNDTSSPERISANVEPSPRPPTSAPSNPVVEAPAPTRQVQEIVSAPTSQVQEFVQAPTRRSKRPFSCPICNGNFKTLVILKTHLSNLHFHNRLLARILQNGSTFSCPEDKCPFQSNKKEDVTSHITDEHDIVFRIAKELFPNFTTEPLGSAPENTTTSSDASKNDTPQTTNKNDTPQATTATESLKMSNVPADPVHQISTAPVLSEVPQMTTTSPISTAFKRRSTESIETDLKKQKLEKKTTRKVDLPMKPKINVQTATIRPLTRDIVSNKVSSPVGNKISNPPPANKTQENLPQNVVIIPQTVMESGQLVMQPGQSGQLVMQPGQQYFLTQGILPQWAPAGGNNQPWMRNNFQM